MAREHSANPPGLPVSAQGLGYAGLVPQILLAAVVVAGPPRFSAAAAAVALAYAGTILSFIGGAWWGLAARSQSPVPWSLWVAAVIPSLIAFAVLGGWHAGLPTRAALIAIGVALIGTLGVDQRFAARHVALPGWLRLRIPLSCGLGGLTTLIAILS